MGSERLEKLRDRVRIRRGAVFVVLLAVWGATPGLREPGTCNALDGVLILGATLVIVEYGYEMELVYVCCNRQHIKVELLGMRCTRVTRGKSHTHNHRVEKKILQPFVHVMRAFKLRNKQT